MIHRDFQRLCPYRKYISKKELVNKQWEVSCSYYKKSRLCRGGVGYCILWEKQKIILRRVESVKSEKRCSLCKVIKPLIEFPLNTDGSYRKRCSECDPVFISPLSLKSRLLRAAMVRIRGKAKGITKVRCLELLGCSVDEFYSYIISKLKSGMTEDNYGNNKKSWIMDHIKPLNSFPLQTKEGQAKAFHHTNIQPLWWAEHLTKSLLENRRESGVIKDNTRLCAKCGVWKDFSLYPGGSQGIVVVKSRSYCSDCLSAMGRKNRPLSVQAAVRYIISRCRDKDLDQKKKAAVFDVIKSVVCAKAKMKIRTKREILRLLKK